MKNYCWETFQEEKCSDEGYSVCTRYRDDGYKKCESWFFLFRWLCTGWYWVSNLICVTFVWISIIVCKVYEVIKLVLCTTIQFVTEVVAVIVNVLESVVGWVLSAVAFIFDLILSIPIIGRIIRIIINILAEGLWQLVGVVDFLAGLLGIRPLKKLRICPIILLDEDNNELISPVDAIPFLQEAVDIYYNAANVLIYPPKAFKFNGGYTEKPVVDESWFKLTRGDSIIDVGCGGDSIVDDLWVAGSGFEGISMSNCFYGNFRRLIGYGGPIVVYFIRSVNGTSTLGCSNLFLTDYITVESNNPICISHELGHACTLGHVSDSNNLMYRICGNKRLSGWQITRLRNSRHVTYF